MLNKPDRVSLKQCQSEITIIGILVYERMSMYAPIIDQKVCMRQFILMSNAHAIGINNFFGFMKNKLNYNQFSKYF